MKINPLSSLMILVTLIFTFISCDLFMPKDDPIPTFSITYNANGADSGTAPANQVKTEGINLTLASNSGTLVRADYTFAGWNTAADGSGIDYAVGVTDSTEADLTLYAKWQAIPTVTITSITGVTVPVLGATPVTSITETDQYTGTVTWNPADSPFAAATVYTATITLTAKAGYTLTGVTANFFTVAGITSLNTAGSGVVTVEFPATVLPIVVNIAAISGVTVTVLGATPVEAITTDQYTGTVTWNPADSPFAAETVYIATISLTAKAGYTLTGVTANFFTVAGATSLNTAGSGVVTAEFPATATVINIAAISGVTVPVLGATPVTSIAETTQYTGVVTWDGNWIGHRTFAGNKVYTATITLTAKSGYTLTGVAEGLFTVAGTTSDTNPANSGVVTAEFPATADWVTYTLGQTGPAGGLIFYINPYAATDDWKYLETWTADEAGTSQWKTSNTSTAGTSTDIGTGYANTYTYMTGTEHPAAEVVRNATHGGSSDWFLPSMDELNAIWDNLVDNGSGVNNGVGGFGSGYYWSSSNYDNYSALWQYFFSGSQNNDGKYNNLCVRPVRAF